MKDFDKDLFARLLRSARGQRSINHYGNTSQVDPSYISRLERKLVAKPPSPEIIKKLAQKACGVSYEDFMVAAGYVDTTKDYNLFKEDLYLFQAAENMPEYSALEDLEKLRLEEFFSFRMQDDSMRASRILKGDKHVGKREDQGDDGQITLLVLEGKELMVRRLHGWGEKFILQPDNPLYNLSIVEKENVRILGKVVQVLFTP